MKNLSNLLIEEIKKGDRRHMGGWTSYCEFYEVKTSQGTIVAQVNEEDATIVLPYQDKKVLFFDKAFSLKKVESNYIVIEFYKSKKTKKLWFENKPKALR